MKKLLYCLGLLLLLTNLAFAGVPVDSQYYFGTRTTPDTSGVDSTGGYAEAEGGFSITWDISFDGTYWNYSYTFTDKDGSTINPEVSHWIVEISPEVDLTNIDDYVFDANAPVVIPPGGDVWPEDTNFPNTTNAGGGISGNPNLGTDLHGIKFDTGSNNVSGTYTFKSVEPPVWGDFYVK